MAHPPGAPGALRRLATALLLSALAGLLLAALALPVLGAGGWTARAASSSLLDLPAELSTPAPPTRSKILAADGSLLATMFVQNRINVALASVPLQARQALIAIEDNRFYAHSGVDYKGTVRAAVTNARSGRVAQGGSTLTQQYVKNALLLAATDKAGQAAAREDSLSRKLREARYAMALERTLTKDEILERYLNIAYYGNGAYGIGAAANYYFGKPVGGLTLAEGALLAGTVQNPSRFDPVPTDPARRAAVVARRDTVLSRMADLGYVDRPTADAAAAEPIHLDVHQVKSGCENPAVGAAAYFCDYVRRELEDTDVGAALGDGVQARQQTLYGGGLVIRTTLDRTALAAAQKAADGRIPQANDLDLAAAVDVVEPGTGSIKAMAVNRSYPTHQVNLATGGISGFQAGSTFKPFVLATALQNGVPLDLALSSPPTYYPKAFPYLDENGHPAQVKNAEENEGGTFDLISGTHESVNTYYIQIEEKTGFDAPAGLAESLGVRNVKAGRAAPLSHRNASFVFGTDSVSPLAMAGAYAAFAAHGSFCPPRAVLSITGPGGQELPVPPQHCQQVLDSAIADSVTSVLRGVIDGPDPLRTGLGAAIGRPAAGKTGTTNGARAAWFVGYTPQLATAVWVGKPTPTPLVGVTVNGTYYKQVYGGTIPADIWHDTMLGALEGVPPTDLQNAPLLVSPHLQLAPGQTGTGTVPNVRGLSLEQALQVLTHAGFSPVIGPRVGAAPVPDGAAAYTSPGSGRAAAPGRTVTVYVSDGLAPAPRFGGLLPSVAGDPGATASATPSPSTSATPPRGTHRKK